jgi:tetratricopeptide (TPR) repeat protein
MDKIAFERKLSLTFMKNLLTLVLIIIALPALGQQTQASALEEEAKINKRLLPRYGLLQKTEREIEADKRFISETMKQPQFKGDFRAASNHLIRLGFNYLYRGDLRTAMYRFNQAYLLDSTNTDIYWGYGGFYMMLGNFNEAQKQYSAGLTIDPQNHHLLTDYGTYFMNQYYELEEAGYHKDALENLESGISYLSKSYLIDNNDQNTSYKLSVCYWVKGDCEKAWEFYNKCKELGGEPITEEYTSDLKKKCRNSASKN